MVYYGNPQQLEYDFVVTPGTDPSTIKLALLGADQLEINSLGDLVLHTAGEQLQLHKPLVYQEIDGVKQAISGDYILKDQHLVSFRVGEYDTKKPLIIDPVLAYSTYLGGSGRDNGNSIAVDAEGNAYIIGYTNSFIIPNDFPTKNPLQPPSFVGANNVFVTKLNPEGTALVYSTYLGGGSDEGYGIAVDDKGSAYVTGRTLSANFPTKNPLQPNLSNSFDAFVAKLNPEGSALVYSTYLGGSGMEYSSGIAVDYKGNAYVTGFTSSTDFPTENPLQPTFAGQLNNSENNAFIAKLNPEGSALVYSTYLSGANNTFGGGSFGFGIAVDYKGQAYVTGTTSSTDFPTKNPLQPNFGGRSSDAFVAKLNSEGTALVYSTYLGGSKLDEGRSIAIDAKGNAYVTGTTVSTDFPTEKPLQVASSGIGYNQQDAFVAKLNPKGTALVYSTYLGGSKTDYGQGIAVKAKGSAYVMGTTFSTDFPTKNPLQDSLGSNGGTFVVELNTQGTEFVYSTYIRGSGNGGGIAVDTVGSAYVTGTTFSTDLQLKNPFQDTLDTVYHQDAFVTKLAEYNKRSRKSGS